VAYRIVVRNAGPATAARLKLSIGLTPGRQEVPLGRRPVPVVGAARAHQAHSVYALTRDDAFVQELRGAIDRADWLDEDAYKREMGRLDSEIAKLEAELESRRVKRERSGSNGSWRISRRRSREGSGGTGGRAGQTGKKGAGFGFLAA
jgi:hypothetical protein